MVAARRITLDVAARWLTPRGRGAHKGDAGRVYVIAGSRGMAGAAVLSALGAVRSGAGLVRVGTVKSQQPVVARRAPLEVTSEGFLEGADGRFSAGAWSALRRSLESFKPDVIAIGPGLGRSRGIEALLRKILFHQTAAVVVDADALNTLSELEAAKFVTPAEAGAMLRREGMRLADISGMRFSPLSNRWKETTDTGVNYILAARKD